MAHNTTYHASLKCAPTEILHGRIPHSAFDHIFANPIRVDNQPTAISKMLNEVKKTQKKSDQHRKYHKYKTYYDRRASAQPLKVNKFVFPLNPQYDDQSSKQHFKSFQ